VLPGLVLTTMVPLSPIHSLISLNVNLLVAIAKYSTADVGNNAVSRRGPSVRIDI
jgi:hypothetical protein